MMMKGKDRSSPLRTRKAKEQWIKRKKIMGNDFRQDPLIWEIENASN